MNEAARLRLALLPLIPAGTRDRNPSGIEFHTRTYRPTRAIPPVVQVMYDPDDLRTIALLTETGEFICDAIARDLPLEVALSEDEVKRLFTPTKSSRDRDRQARRNLFELITASAEGSKLSRREASALDAAKANATRPIALREPIDDGAITAEPAASASEDASGPKHHKAAVPSIPAVRKRLRLAPPAPVD